MTDIPYHTWYSLVRLRRFMAAEVEASRPDRRAWVVVAPFKADLYRFSRFEIDRVLLDSGYDVGPPDIHYGERVVVTEDELELTIMKFLGDPTLLVPPHQCDYPL